MSETAAGSISLPHYCPCTRFGCSAVAHNYQSMDSIFGFRTIDEAIRNQSWCKECRSKAAQEAKRLAAQKAK